MVTCPGGREGWTSWCFQPAQAVQQVHCVMDTGMMWGLHICCQLKRIVTVAVCCAGTSAATAPVLAVVAVGSRRAQSAACAWRWVGHLQLCVAGGTTIETHLLDTPMKCCKVDSFLGRTSAPVTLA